MLCADWRRCRSVSAFKASRPGASHDIVAMFECSGASTCIMDAVDRTKRRCLLSAGIAQRSSAYNVGGARQNPRRGNFGTSLNYWTLETVERHSRGANMQSVVSNSASDRRIEAIVSPRSTAWWYAAILTCAYGATLIPDRGSAAERIASLIGLVAVAWGTARLDRAECSMRMKTQFVNWALRTNVRNRSHPDA